MKILFFAERVNLNEFKGDSLLLKRMAEGLAEKNNEVHAVCHGLSEKIKIHSPLNFWFYTKAFSFPLTSFFSFRNFKSLLNEISFDAVIIKLPAQNGSGFWFNLGPLIKSNFYLKIAFELEKRKIPFFVFVEGITEKENFVSSFMGCSKENQLQLMNQSNGIISLSKLQNQVLFSFGLKKPATFFPAPVDTKKYCLKKSNSELNLFKDKINLLYLSSSCDLKDFIAFFDFLKSNNCVLHIISPARNKNFLEEIKKRKLAKKIVFLPKLSNEKLFKIIPAFDAGVYLKKFNSIFADSSYMMKISEYLSCGLPVLVPNMVGPLSQTDNAGINFQKQKKISKNQLQNLSLTARKIAVEKLDLEKNIEKIEGFINENK